MNKKIILVLSLVIVAMLSLSSCELIVKDPEVDKKTVIVELGDENITKEEVNNTIEQIKFYYQNQYGNSVDLNTPEYKENIQNSAINSLIAEKVIDKKIKELGFDILSDEELDNIKKECEKDYQSYLDGIKSIYFADSDLKGDELDKAIEAKADEFGYNSIEDSIDIKSKSKKLENLKNDLIKDVTVSDEEIKSDYDSKVTQSRINVENKPELYSSYVLGGSPVYYAPAGYRNIKQILVKFTDEDMKNINSLKSDINEKENQISTVKKSIEEETNTAKENQDKEENNTNRIDALNSSLKQYESDLNELNNKLDESKDKAYKNIQNKVDKVLAALSNDSNTFDKVFEEYNEDPRMNQEPFKTIGYPMSASSTIYDSSIKDVAMNLKNVGDVSDIVKGDSGYYILKYQSDVKEGPVDFDSVKDSIKKSILDQKQNDAYNNQIQKWIDESNAKIHADRMK